MPLYDWQCEHCELKVTVMHHHSKSGDSPSDEELVAEESPVYCNSNATEGQHKWKMLIGKCNFQINGYSYRNGYSK